jgi:hypothetical protein
MPGFWILIGRVGIGPVGLPTGDVKKLVIQASSSTEEKIGHQPGRRDPEDRQHGNAFRKGRGTARGRKLRDEHSTLILVLGNAGYVVGGALGSARGADKSVRADGASILRRLAADARRWRVSGSERSTRKAVQLRMGMAARPDTRKVHDRVHRASFSYLTRPTVGRWENRRLNSK